MKENYTPDRPSREIDSKKFNVVKGIAKIADNIVQTCGYIYRMNKFRNNITSSRSV